jgi:hypothetical protein
MLGCSVNPFAVTTSKWVAVVGFTTEGRASVVREFPDAALVEKLSNEAKLSNFSDVDRPQNT